MITKKAFDFWSKRMDETHVNNLKALYGVFEEDEAQHSNVWNTLDSDYYHASLIKKGNRIYCIVSNNPNHQQDLN